MRSAVLLILAMLLTGGCALNEASRSQFVAFKNFTRGEHYLSTKQYAEGLGVFEREVSENPADPYAHYYLGRCRLALNQPQPALAALKRAAALKPDDADFLFWLGVAQGSNGDGRAERKTYLRVLALKPDHVQALVYLGHNRLEAGEERTALGLYNKALRLVPTIPQALYNRGLILRNLGRTPEEIEAWKIYLDTYSEGAFARLAAEHLNSHGDFTYRNHLIGRRTLTLRRITFAPLGSRLDKTSEDALKALAEIMARTPGLRLDVIVYQKRNLKLAEVRAKRVKYFLMRQNSAIEGRRIRLSWFDQPETVAVGGRTFLIDQSVNVFGALR